MSHLQEYISGRGNVKISLDPKTWPQKAGESGFVPHWALMADPKQPRRYIDPDELQALKDSLAAQGQREIAKVRVLTEIEQQKFTVDGLVPRYMLVSGEQIGRAHV